MTTLLLIFCDPATPPREVTITYTEFLALFRSASWDGLPLASIEVEHKHADKGPNRITFE